MHKINVVLGFDMETDIGSFTPFYTGLKNGTPVILDILRRNEITGTFYFTGDSAVKHKEIAAGVRDAGHEVGCHTMFHETIGDEIFPVAGMVPILPEEVFHRIEIATSAVEDAAGIRPVSFRAPRLFGSTVMINALEKLGYVSDASYPMYFFRKQLVPYHPDSSDWTCAGDMKITELPNFADLSLDSKDEYGRDMDQWPLFRTKGAGYLIEHINNFIGFCVKRGITEPFLCFYFHPWEFYKMPEGDIRIGEGTVRPDKFIVENCGEKAAEELEKVLVYLKENGAVFHQAKKIAERI
jgi:hypothetical protein